MRKYSLLSAVVFSAALLCLLPALVWANEESAGLEAPAQEEQIAADAEAEPAAQEEQVAADTEAEPAAREEQIAADTEAEPAAREDDDADIGGVQAEVVVRLDCPQNYKSRGKITHGGRVAFSHFNNKKVNPSGDWKESRAKGMIVSPGLAMSIPLADAVSLNHELVLDIRSIDLEVDVYVQTPTTWTLEKLNVEGLKEYVLCLPITLRADIDPFPFFVESGVRFDYLYTSNSNYWSANFLNGMTSRPQIDMDAILGAGYTFSLFSANYYLGYRIEGNITQFDTRNFFRFRRHTFGLTVMTR